MQSEILQLFLRNARTKYKKNQMPVAESLILSISFLYFHEFLAF